MLKYITYLAFIFYISLMWSFCLFVCFKFCVFCVCGCFDMHVLCLWRAEEGIRSPKTAVTNVVSSCVGAIPLEEQPVQ